MFNSADAEASGGAPEDWTWAENRIDPRDISDKDFAGLRRAEERFRFRRDWEPASISEKQA